MIRQTAVKPAPTGATALQNSSASGCRQTSPAALASAMLAYTNSAIQAAGTWTYMIRTVSPCR